jgi:putative transposase
MPPTTTLAMSSVMTSSASLPSLLRVITDNAQQGTANAAVKKPPIKKARTKNPDAVEKVAVARTRKIRIYPTTKQRVVLNDWFDTARWTYNRCVDACEDDGTSRNKKTLRNLWLNNATLEYEYEWALRTPYDVRNEAMCDVLKAYKTNFALLRAKHIKRFKMKHRESKATSQSIVIHSKHWKKKKKKKEKKKKTQLIFYDAAFKKRGAETTLRTSEPLPDVINYDCRLQRTRLGHYYFCLLLPAQPSDNQARITTDTNETPKILAIDPGVRTFLTGYEPSTGRYIEWGKGDKNRIERLGVHLDNLMSRTAKSKSARQKYKMRKAQWRMRLRIRNLVDEFHKKLVKWLHDNYELVLLPAFETSGMVRTSHRRISRPSVRAMLTWAFYRFKQRLLMKTVDSSCCVIIVDEHHTTMTCGRCGCLNRNVGASKVFECPACDIVLPRDWNAARNIFLRYLAMLPPTQSLSAGAGLRLGAF